MQLAITVARLHLSRLSLPHSLPLPLPLSPALSGCLSASLKVEQVGHTETESAELRSGLLAKRPSDKNHSGSSGTNSSWGGGSSSEGEGQQQPLLSLSQGIVPRIQFRPPTSLCSCSINAIAISTDRFSRPITITITARVGVRVRARARARSASLGVALRAEDICINCAQAKHTQSATRSRRHCRAKSAKKLQIENVKKSA